MAQSSPTRRAAFLVVALIGLVFLLPPRIAALTRIAPSMAYLIDESEVIVYGVLREESDAIEVSSYLRGRGPKRLATALYPAPDDVFDRAFPFDRPGVFFLRRRGGEFVPTGWTAFSPDRAYVQNLMHIARDPGPFLSSPRWRQNTDLIEFLGRRFNSFKVTSAGAPDLADFLTRDRIDPFPWAMKGRRVVAMTTEKAAPYRVNGDGTAAGERLAAILNHNPVDWKGWSDRQATPPQFTLEFDLRRPTRWGSIGPEAAIEVLEEAVRSRASWVVPEATRALSRMRADEAVPDVIPLLDHHDPEHDPERDVVRAAIRFLTRSHDPRAARAMKALADRGEDESTRLEAAAVLTCFSGEAAALRLRCHQ